jgi:Uma2 family endonuclease
MQAYLENAVRLGWLLNPETRHLNPETRQVEVYRPDREKVVLAPTELSGEEVLPGFMLDLIMIW